ncbi:MAG: ABC transporter ATP-binding protein [Thermotoga sp.]|nr:ABC transporter ATP-binding protein [Thermotoga sp.]
METVLKVEGLEKEFDGVKVIEDWRFVVKRGERIALLGPSGCGKTTFLRIVAGIESFRGKVEVSAEKLGYVFQDSRLIPWRTVRGNLWVISGNESRASYLLDRVGLKGFENHYPWQLSEGMKQRVNLVRALLVEPDLLLLDEPFDALDLRMKKQVMELLLEEWNERGFSMVFVTHDVKEAVFLSDRIFLLSGRPTRIVDEVKIDERVRDIMDEKLFKLEKMVINRILNLPL